MGRDREGVGWVGVVARGWSGRERVGEGRVWSGVGGILRIEMQPEGCLTGLFLYYTIYRVLAHTTFKLHNYTFSGSS